MLVFIDDSGDPGFKIEKGSSVVFVIALVIFDDDLEAEKTAVEIKQLKRDLKFPDDVEFKFHQSRIQVKRKFLQKVSRHKFRIRAIVVKKENIRSPFLTSNKGSFYNYIVMQVLRNSKKNIKKAKLKFDRRGEKRIRDNLRVYLSRELDNRSNHIFEDLKFVDSKTNVLIQFADMVAGAIGSYYKNKDKGLMAFLKKRIEDIWEFK
ncbi:MAG: DUF3800 domain-containing protein [Candidatus Levybacteria bacterium]|nr:DUF3800 domain-containing protein [Candidatus Levybacteria bacterium]